MKIAFYFTLKAHFVLKIFKILSWVFGPVNSFIRKKSVISKFMKSQPVNKQMQYTYCIISQDNEIWAVNRI